MLCFTHYRRRDLEKSKDPELSDIFYKLKGIPRFFICIQFRTLVHLPLLRVYFGKEGICIFNRRMHMGNNESVCEFQGLRIYLTSAYYETS